jgi:hypothetical protein
MNRASVAAGVPRAVEGGSMNLEPAPDGAGEP